MQPVRHALGALLLARGLIVEAEQAYREDLEKYPKNMWSLVGLSEILEKDPTRALEARSVKEQAALASARADVVVDCSCFCKNRNRCCNL